MRIEREEMLLIAFIVALLGGLIWLTVAYASDMSDRREAFMERCLREREAYDCELQWDTFAAAKSAEINAAVAMGRR